MNFDFFIFSESNYNVGGKFKYRLNENKRRFLIFLRIQECIEHQYLIPNEGPDHQPIIIFLFFLRFFVKIIIDTSYNVFSRIN